MEQEATCWRRSQQHNFESITAREKDYFLALSIPTDDDVTSGHPVFDHRELLTVGSALVSWPVGEVQQGDFDSLTKRNFDDVSTWWTPRDVIRVADEAR